MKTISVVCAVLLSLAAGGGGSNVAPGAASKPAQRLQAITVQLVSQAINPGNTATFAVVATARAPDINKGERTAQMSAAIVRRCNRIQECKGSLQAPAQRSRKKSAPVLVFRA